MPYKLLAHLLPKIAFDPDLVEESLAFLSQEITLLSGARVHRLGYELFKEKAGDLENRHLTNQLLEYLKIPANYNIVQANQNDIQLLGPQLTVVSRDQVIDEHKPMVQEHEVEVDEPSEINLENLKYHYPPKLMNCTGGTIEEVTPRAMLNGFEFEGLEGDFQKVMSPIADKLHKQASAHSHIAHLVYTPAHASGINTKFHVDFPEDFRQYHHFPGNNFEDPFTYTISLSEKGDGPTTEYLGYNGIVEYPHLSYPDFVQNGHHELARKVITLMIDQYTSRLAKKYALPINSLPPNQWVRVPRLWIHRSPDDMFRLGTPRYFYSIFMLRKYGVYKY